METTHRMGPMGQYEPTKKLGSSEPIPTIGPVGGCEQPGLQGTHSNVDTETPWQTCILSDVHSTASCIQNTWLVIAATFFVTHATDITDRLAHILWHLTQSPHSESITKTPVQLCLAKKQTFQIDEAESKMVVWLLAFTAYIANHYQPLFLLPNITSLYGLPTTTTAINSNTVR